MCGKKIEEKMRLIGKKGNFVVKRVAYKPRIINSYAGIETFRLVMK